MIAILLHLLKAHCGTEYSHKSVTGGKKTTTTTTKPKHNYSSLRHVNLKADCGTKKYQYGQKSVTYGKKTTTTTTKPKHNYSSLRKPEARHGTAHTE